MSIAGGLTFRYGTMNSGKSVAVLQTVHTYTSRGIRGTLFGSGDRNGDSRVTARIGLSAECVPVTESFSFVSYLSDVNPRDREWIVVDEGQFLTAEQVDELAWVADEWGIPVEVFGLLTDFRSVLFEGSRRLVEVADRVELMPVRALCWCGKTATHQARLVGGQIVREGEQVAVGDVSSPSGGSAELSYEVLCRKHHRTGHTA